MLKTVSEICVAADTATEREDIDKLLEYVRQNCRSYSLVDLSFVLEHLSLRKKEIVRAWWREFAQESSELLTLLGIRFKG